MSFRAALRPFALAAAMLFGAAAGAGAEVADPNDPPSRVGRLAHMDGTVSFRTSDSDQWVPATLNYPITSGDGLWTEPNARAEIQIGSADLRLDSTSAIQILQLDDSATRIQVDQGSINLRVRDLPPGGVQIVTPRGTMSALRPGRYHVDMAPPEGQEPGDRARFAVLEGEARVDGVPGSGTAPLTVTAGHAATLRDGDTPPLLAQAIARPLDTWALERERLLNPQETVRYVSPEMTGYQDLDRYGQWAQEPDYGAIWYPRATVVDWAPYRYGHWAYVRPWGWTWIDHQPWGFAPFHYGRWVRVRDRWGWYPGARVVRPVYAPALVAFVGGNNFNLTVISGRRAPAVAWVPLGPREVYRPYYRHSPAYVRNVNITQVTNVTVIDNDRRGPGNDWDRGRNGRDGNWDRDRDDRDSVRNFRNREALTAVSSDSFTRAESVSRARVSVRDDDVAGARRSNSLDYLRPSLAARSGAVTPASFTTDRGPSGRGDNDRAGDSRSSPATPAIARPDESLPRAPGPSRDFRASRNGRAPEQARATDGGSSNTARPTVNSLTAPGARSNQPAAGSPRDTSARPSPGPARSVSPDGRETRLGRETDRTPNNESRNQPRQMAPQMAPPQSTPRGSDSPNTAAPSPPARLQAVPSETDRGRRDGTVREPRSMGRSGENAPAQPRAATPTPSPMPTVQRPARQENAAPRPMQNVPQQQRSPQVNEQRRESREVRREPTVRQDSPQRAPQQQQQQQQQQRPTPQRENSERRSQPQAQPQRFEQRSEPRREMRSEPRRETPRPQPQMSAPRDSTPRQAEQPRTRPQEAQRPSNRRGDDQRRNGG